LILILPATLDVLDVLDVPSRFSSPHLIPRKIKIESKFKSNSKTLRGNPDKVSTPLILIHGH